MVRAVPAGNAASRQVAREFADQGVKLVAVNLAETPDQVRTALTQLQLDMPVALDRQGRVAEQYGAMPSRKRSSLVVTASCSASSSAPATILMINYERLSAVLTPDDKEAK